MIVERLAAVTAAFTQIALSLADEVPVMVQGQLRLSAAPKDLLARSDLLEQAYLGGHAG